MDYSSCKTVVDLQQHVFDHASSGGRPQKLEWNSSLKAGLWFSQPARCFCDITEDLFSLGSDTCYSESGIRFVVRLSLIDHASGPLLCQVLRYLRERVAVKANQLLGLQRRHGMVRP
jgi:hypothetical protein